MDIIEIMDVARITHEVNRALCQAFGDESQPAWADAPDWQVESAVQGVKFHLENPEAGPQVSHSNWCKKKFFDGWKYGPVKDATKKEHPCLVLFKDLPVEQQAKDHVFRAVVHAVCGL